MSGVLTMTVRGACDTPGYCGGGTNVVGVVPGGMTDWYLFACPACSAEFVVDGSARGDLLRVGCVRCGAAVSSEVFSRRSAPAV